MDIAIVTGANSRIGLAISQKLIEIGCRVYGLGSNFNDFPLAHADFVPVTCDLTRTEHLCQVVQEIIQKEKNIYVLVNHAKHINLAAHETQGINDLESLVHTNLLAPLLLVRLALPSLVRLNGYILNIGFPDLPGSHRLGSAFLSTEVALQHFSDRLYEEVRQENVKVCSLILDTANVSTLFKEGFTERENNDLIVCSEAIAQAVEYIVSQKRDSVISRVVVRPQKRDPDAGDRAGVRQVEAPLPYAPRKLDQRVIIGRLQKEVEKPSLQKVPATYVEMARQVTAEESRQEAVSTPPGQTSSEPPPNKRRRRRRGRNRNRDRGDLATEVSPSDKSPTGGSLPQPTEAKRQVGGTSVGGRGSKSGPTIARGTPGRTKSGPEKRVSERPDSRAPSHEEKPARKRPARKKTSGRSSLPDKPAQASEAAVSPDKKVDVKKGVKKQVAKKAVRKRVTPKPQES